MIEFFVDGRVAGDVLKFDRPARIRVRGKAESQFPFQQLEVVYNGEVVATGRLSADKLSGSIDEELNLPRSGWIALRAMGPVVAYWAGGPRAAHTNPVYVEVTGMPMDSTADAKYFLAWIDRLEAMLKARDRMHTGRQHVESQVSRARAVYRELVARGAAQ